MPNNNNQTAGPIAWGYRSREIEAERVAGAFVTLEIPVYRIRFWGRRAGQDLYLLQQSPVYTHRVVLN